MSASCVRLRPSSQVPHDLLRAQILKAGSADFFDADEFHFATGHFFVSFQSQ
jgi:hypothetical protein